MLQFKTELDADTNMILIQEMNCENVLSMVNKQIPIILRYSFRGCNSVKTILTQEQILPL